MATIFQQLGGLLGLSNSEPLVSGNAVTPGTTNAAFHLDIHQSGGTGEQIMVATPQDAVLNAEMDRRAILIGGSGDDHLTGGNEADLILGGGGTNVMTGGGGADTFGHAARATDVVTDFSAAAGEHIAVQSGLTLTGSAHATVNPADFGLTGSPAPAVVLSFADNSQMILLHNSETPTADWFV